MGGMFRLVPVPAPGGAPRSPASRLRPGDSALRRLWGHWAVSLALTLALGGCITSPVSDYGATGAAKEARLSDCPNGLIDDLEDGNAQVTELDGRNGYWFTFVDPWGSTVQPKGHFQVSEEGVNGGKHVAKAWGKLAEEGDSLYAGLGFAFTNPKTPYDASRAKGIRFWAKGPGRIRLKVPDRNTAPEGDRCTDCYNDFGVDLYLQDEWVRYTVPFDRMKQQPGWGDRAPAIDSSGLLSVQWLFGTAGRQFEISIDRVELVGCGEPLAQ